MSKICIVCPMCNSIFNYEDSSKNPDGSSSDCIRPARAIRDSRALILSVNLISNPPSRCFFKFGYRI